MKAFGSRYIYAGLGTSLVIGPDINSNVRRGEAPAFDDLAVYRKLASRED
jgi:7,8-dihydropterin-6-yl-methyl-4-(beta-D-ribofuranosyl)aminobenzene 5'-phosphate synthase